MTDILHYSTLSQSIIRVVDESVVPVTYEDIMLEVNAPVDYIRTYSNRLAKRGKIRKISRGRYVSVEPVPVRPDVTDTPAFRRAWLVAQ